MKKTFNILLKLSQMSQLSRELSYVLPHLLLLPTWIRVMKQEWGWWAWPQEARFHRAWLCVALHYKKVRKMLYCSTADRHFGGHTPRRTLVVRCSRWSSSHEGFLLSSVPKKPLCTTQATQLQAAQAQEIAVLILHCQTEVSAHGNNNLLFIE